MAFLVAPRSLIEVPSLPRGPALGTCGIYRVFDGELHGQELLTLFDAVAEVYRRREELPRHLTTTAEHVEDDLGYDPVPPTRTFQAKVVFVNVGPMLPLKFDFSDS